MASLESAGRSPSVGAMAAAAAPRVGVERRCYLAARPVMVVVVVVGLLRRRTTTTWRSHPASRHRARRWRQEEVGADWQGGAPSAAVDSLLLSLQGCVPVQGAVVAAAVEVAQAV